MIDSNQQVWCKGQNSQGQLGVSDCSVDVPKIIDLVNIVSVSAGTYYSLFLDGSGFVWSCGKNNFGQLGLGHSWTIVTPQKIPNLPSIHSISASLKEHSLFLDCDGAVWCCGLNRNYQLGKIDGKDRYIPKKLEDLPRMIDIAAGYFHSIFLDEEGNVWMSGSFRYRAPTKLTVPKVIKAIAAANGSLLLDVDDVVWRLNKGGYDLVEINDLPPIREISEGMNCLIFLDYEGTVWNCVSQKAGMFDDPPQYRSYKIDSLQNIRIKEICAGDEVSMYLDIEGCVWATLNHSKLPERISGIPSIGNKLIHVKSARNNCSQESGSIFDG